MISLIFNTSVYLFFAGFMMIIANDCNRLQGYKRNILLLVMCCCFALFAGLRYDVGVDYFGYLASYNYATFTGKIVSSVDGVENEIIPSVIVFISIPFCSIVYFFLLALWQITFYVLSFRKALFILPAIFFVMMTNGEFFMWMNGIRQCMAMVVFLFATDYILQRRPFMFAIFMFIAINCHSSAAILIPFYLFAFNQEDSFIRRNKLTKIIDLLLSNRVVQILLLLLAISLTDKNIWSNFYGEIANVSTFIGKTRYENLEETGDKIWTREYALSYRYYINALICSIIICLSKGMREFYKDEKFKFNLFYTLAFIGMIAYYLFYQNTFMQRPFIYFISFQNIIGGMALYYLYKEHKNNRFFTILLIFLVVLYIMILSLYVHSNISTVYKLNLIRTS